MRGGLQKLFMSILRPCDQRGKPLFDRALSDRTHLIRVGVRDKQRTGRDDRQRGDGNTCPHRLSPILFLAPGSSGRYSTKRLDAPVVGMLPRGERNDEQPARREAY